MISFERQNSVPAADELALFEATLGAPLPADYRDFVEKVNGGRPIEYEAKVSGWGNVPLNSLLGLGAPGRSDLALQTLRMKSRLPTGVLPIGTDSGGNYFCLATTGDRLGAVLFWDHENSTPDVNGGEEEFRLYYVADTFTAFLASLRRI